MTEDEVLAIARAGAAAGLPRSALHARRQARAALQGRARGAARARLRDDARVPRALRAARPRGDGPAAAPEPRRHDPRGARGAAAGLGVDGDHARDDRRAARREGRAALGLARQGPGAPPGDDPARGRAPIPFTSGILIGIGETREERIDALLALKALGEEHGHVQEVIVQNFRAKPGTRMAAHPEPSLDDHLWTIAVARILLGPAWHVQAPPNLAFDDFPRLLDAGIDDWGGVSPVTIDHVNPEAPWPEIERLAEATALARARARAASSASIPSTSPSSTAGSIRRSRRTSFARPTRAASRATTRGRRASRSRVPFVVRRDAPPLELDRRRARRGRAHAPPRGARGRGGTRLRRGRRAAPRGVRRRGHLRRDAEHPVHERLLLPLRLLRVLEGQARGEPARRAVPRPARRDRPAHRGGVGARRDRGLPPGRDPSGLHRRLLRERRPRDQRRRPRDPRARVLGARGLAGRGDARPLARRVPRASRATSGSARSRARRRRCSTTRCGA